MPSLELRRKLIANREARGILTVFHYVPLHLYETGRKFGGNPGERPITDRISVRPGIPIS